MSGYICGRVAKDGEAELLLDSLPSAEMFTIFMCCLHSGSVLSASRPCV